jgi:phosphoribosylaminoimidazole carboxylase (NCAIR synthetase)
MNSLDFQQAITELIMCIILKRIALATDGKGSAGCAHKNQTRLLYIAIGIEL